jgi:acyl-coenzyme A synthetase/AMP-(fatty) acid ligase
VSAEPAWSLGSITALAARKDPKDVAAFVPEAIPVPGIERKTTLTFRDLETVVGRAAMGLRKTGVETGDVVAVVLRSNLDGLLAAMAASRAGATPALLYGGMPDNEIGPLVKHANAVRLIGPEPDALAKAIDAAGAESLRPPANPPETAVVLYTSGTTGRPKGVPLRTESLESALRFARLRPEITPGRDDRGIAALPLAHVMGLVQALAYIEARMPATFLPRFTVDGAFDAIEETKATIFAGVPGIYQMLDRRADERDLSSVRVWVSGADAMPRDLARRFQHRGSSLAVAGRKVAPAFFVEGYGLVEATGPALFRIMGPIGLMRKYRPLPGWRTRAVTDDGEPVPNGEEGILELSGPGVFRGYLGDEDEQPKEWLRTQDLGTVSRLQAVDITGRSEHMLKVGGHRLHPGEIEEVLLQHPDVEEAGVTGLPHKTMGQVPGAAVVLRKGAKTSSKELVKWCQDHLAKYKVPRDVAIMKDLPRTPTHKLKRKALAEQLTA